MQTTSLSFLLHPIREILPEVDVSIKGLAIDSRYVQPGDLFFAFKGSLWDGRAYIKDAIEKGAVCVLAEKHPDKPDCYFEGVVPVISISELQQKVSEIAARFYHNPGALLDTVGITGTNGKTSTSHFIAAILQHLAKPCGIMGTLGNGIYGDIKPGVLTTPDAITIQKNLAEYLSLGAKHVAMEVSSHSLDQGRVKHVPFKVGVFTNLTRDHLDYHGTMEAYGAAKAKLFDNPLLENAVINIDDPFGLQLVQSLAGRKQVFAYSTASKRADVPLIYVKKAALDTHGIRAMIATPWGEGELCSSLVGQFNVSNLLAAVTTLCLLDIPFQQVLEGVSILRAVPGRMQTFGGKNKPLIIVDYSHTPDALEQALAALRAHCEGKLYCVFGCGGDRDSGKRPIMATIAEKRADVVIVTDDNPRTEDPALIVADIMKGFSDPNNIIVQHDRSKAIRDVIHYAKPGDCVLIAGKGAETYQQIGEQKIPFSDIDHVIGVIDKC
jgi:UDP-N-acetylmuramoyl-L-alanyl-D-glutamate--2,6-diaminopimelate ligase